MLAAGTIMRSPTGQLNAPDRSLTAAAGKPGSQIDAVLELKEAAHAIGIHIIGDRGAAQPDCIFEHLAQSQPQSLELGPGQASGEPARTNSGTKKALVGVDVAHAGEQFLIEQRRFDGRMRAVKKAVELLRGYCEWVNASRLECGRAAKLAPLQPAKAARVDKAQLAAAGQTQPSMGMGRKRRIRSGDQQPPGHAEMNDPLGGATLHRG